MANALQLRKRGKASSDAFFYDFTSSYFEGSRCVIAKLGYSRDHRPDREQLVIALMITPEGYPFYWRVLAGNTQDITTIESLVSDIKRRFGIEHCTLVFDRGMVSATTCRRLGTVSCRLYPRWTPMRSEPLYLMT